MKGLALICFIFLLRPAPLTADTIVLVADEWCPFNCVAGSNEPGYLVELATKALARYGHTVIYQTLPWSRAITDVRAGHFDGIIGAGTEEVPDFVFPKKPQSFAEHVVFTLAASRWRFENLSSLESIRLGAIDDYSYGDIAGLYIRPNRQNTDRLTILSGQRVIPRLLEMLTLGRIDAFIAERAVLYHALLQEGDVAPPLREAGVASTESLYVAFSPANKHAADYARALGEGVEALRRSGELASLRSRYGLTLADRLRPPESQ